MLVGIGGPRRQRVGAAVDVGIVMGVEVGQGVDDGLRLLRRRGVVEPGERLAVDVVIEDREVAADGGNVEQAAGEGRGRSGGCGSRSRDARLSSRPSRAETTTAYAPRRVSSSSCHAGTSSLSVVNSTCRERSPAAP